MSFQILNAIGEKIRISALSFFHDNFYVSFLEFYLLDEYKFELFGYFYVREVFV
jgi:hypothetical protein